MDATSVSPTTEYPAWQQVIRESQQIITANEAQEAEDSAMQEQQEQARLGALLAEALSLFGIKAEPIPTSQRYELDGIEFELTAEAWEAKPGTKINQKTIKQVTPQGIRYNFGLYVARRLAPTEDDDHLHHFYIPARNLAFDDPRWVEVQGCLAKAIDDANEDYLRRLHYQELAEESQQPFFHVARSTDADAFAVMIEAIKERGYKNVHFNSLIDPANENQLTFVGFFVQPDVYDQIPF